MVDYTLIGIVITGIILILLGVLIIIRIRNKNKKRKQMIKTKLPDESYSKVMEDFNRAEEMRRENNELDPQEILWRVYKERNHNAVKPDVKLIQPPTQPVPVQQVQPIQLVDTKPEVNNKLDLKKILKGGN